MSRLLDATCEAGVVKVEGKPVVATILSQGVKPSTGLAALQSDKLTYLASNASDIHDILVQLDLVLTKVRTALSGIDAVTTSPGSNASLIAQVATAQTTLTALKDNLK